MPAQGQVPSTRPPGYGAEYAAQQAAFDANSAARLKAELEANASAFGDIVGNIKNIAEVSGGAQTPDRLMTMFAGAQDTPIFGTPFAQQADQLRMQKTMADIGAANRSGTGGGGGGIGKVPGNPNVDPNAVAVQLTRNGQTWVQTVDIAMLPLFRQEFGEANVQTLTPNGAVFTNLSNKVATPAVTAGSVTSAGGEVTTDVAGTAAPGPADPFSGLSQQSQDGLRAIKSSDPGATITIDQANGTARVKGSDGIEIDVDLE